MIVLAGLPGVGKSTLATRLGAELAAPVLPVDPIERVLAERGVFGDQAGLISYGSVAALAEVQLGLGLPVIVDAVNPVASTRGLWHDLADRTGVPLRVIEVCCADEAEHRRRVERRHAEAPAGQVATWEQTRVVRAEYEPYIGPRLVVDTSIDADPLPGVLAYLR
ncbi:AAA family ATPase [Micromonospora zhanjiangensis]